MKKNVLLSLIVIAFSAGRLIAQTPGLIYKPASNALGQSVLDPNGDGYTSPNASGFSGTDYTTGSELQMITMPGFVNEPDADVSRGPSGGHTDLVNNGTNHSVYILVSNVGGVDYFIVRFRLGGASSASKGYSVLFDTDGVFGNFPTAGNPGFEKELILESGNSGQVAVYTHSASGATLSHSYNINQYSQRSIALSTINGDADYFYDFFVPMSDLGISGSVRMTATTVINPSSGLNGNVSDINGINDQTFGNNFAAMASAAINSFPSTNISNLTEGGSFDPILSFKPSITGSVTTATTSISGTSLDANGTTITVYKNGVSIGSTTVTSNAWTLNGVSGLTAGDIITVTATATGKSQSLAGGSITVTGTSCYLAPASITTRTNGQQLVSGTWPGTPAANTLRVRVYYQVSLDPTLTEDASTVSTYVSTSGTWSFSSLSGGSQSTFNTRTYYVMVIDSINGCSSVYSEGALGNSSSYTTAPGITTSSVNDSIGPRTIVVQNLHAGTATVTLYVNGVSKGTSGSLAQSATNNFVVTGLNEGDTITARAMSTAANTYLSNNSNKLVVTSRAGQGAAPTISGAYTSGSGKTVTGTSSEVAGTVIYLYKASTTLIGTTAVNLYGNWSISSLTLAGADVLTAKADAPGKTLSAASTAITVASSTPTTPAVTTTPITVGLTSISGTSGAFVAGDSVRMYVDGSLVASVVSGTNWTINFASNQLYRGAEVNVVRTNSAGVSSNATSPVTVTGVTSFKITQTNGSALGSQVAGTPFNIKIQGVDGAGGTGSVIASFTGTVTIFSTSLVLSGDGTSPAFTLGELASHSITLGTAGTSLTLNCINPEDPTSTGTVTFNVTPAIFTGSSSQVYGLAGNWLNGAIPTGGADIQLNGTNTTQDLIMSGDLTLGNITIDQSNHQIITSGNALTITGSLTLSNGGKIDATDGTVVFAGTSAQTIPSGAFVSDTVENLSINNGFGVGMADTLYVTGVVTLTDGVLNSSGNLILVSTAENAYGQISGEGEGSISGDITIQKVIGTTDMGWRHVALPLNGTLADFNGIVIKGTNHGTLNERNTFNWNARVNGGSEAIGMVASALSGTQDSAYIIYGCDNGLHDVSEKWSMPGTPVNGDKSYSLVNSFDPTYATPEARGWNLVPNPYPSNLDVSVLLNSDEFNGISYKAVHVWDLNTSQYRAITASSVTSYNTNDTVLSTTTDFSIFQAFWVKVNSNTTLTLKNTHRTTTMTAGSFLKKEFDLARVRVKDANKMSDELVLYFTPDAHGGLDNGYDAFKIKSMVLSAPCLYSATDDGKLSINALNSMDEYHAVAMGYQSTVKGSATISLDFTALDPKWSVTLEDRVTGKMHNLRESDYSFIHDGQNTERFVLHFNTRPAAIIDMRENTGFTLFQNTEGIYLDAGYGQGEVEITLVNIMGQVLSSQVVAQNGMQKINLALNDSPAMYIVYATHKGETKTLKIIR